MFFLEPFLSFTYACISTFRGNIDNQARPTLERIKEKRFTFDGLGGERVKSGHDRSRFFITLTHPSCSHLYNADYE